MPPEFRAGGIQFRITGIILGPPVSAPQGTARGTISKVTIVFVRTATAITANAVANGKIAVKWLSVSETPMVFYLNFSKGVVAMSSEESNVAILQAAHTRWHETKGGSIDYWLDLLDDNINFGSLAEGIRPLEFTQHRNAKPEVEDYLRSLVEQFDMIHYTIDEYVAQGDRVVAIGSTAWRNKATGKTVETPKVDLFKMKNGRIVEFFEMYDTAKVLAACEPDSG